MSKALFEKRHYDWLAEFLGLELRMPQPSAALDTTTALAARMARRLRETNPRFNEDRFLVRVDEIATGKRRCLY